MPAGTPHAARAQAGVSGHLTVGVLNVTWRSFLEDLVGRALDDPAFASTLPGGWHHDRERFAAQLRDQLDLVVDRIAKVDPEGATAAAADDFLRHRHPLL